MKGKQTKGITLIALVITIIILLILAGIAISTLTGENGILTKASKAKEESNMANAKEKIQLAVMSYQIDKEKTTLYDELIKIEGLTYITPDNRNDGPKYNVIVDGYEFVVKEDLSIEYVGENKDKIIPEITKVEYETQEVETLNIVITAKTEDKSGLKEIRVSYKTQEDGKTKYETVKVEKVTGKEITIEVEIPINGEYVIEAVGVNNQIGKKEITIDNIKQGSILATITPGTVSDQAHVALNIKGQSQGTTIKTMELYVESKKVKTYEYKDIKTIREEIYTIENMEFYKPQECYLKVIDINGKETNSNREVAINNKIIKTATDLRNLSKQVNTQNNTFEGKTVYLIDDISVGENWEPIGYWDGAEGQWSGKYFAGTFEGNGHTVTVDSLSKDTIYKNSGLFGMGVGCTIRKLTVNGTMDAKTMMVGGIIGGAKDGTFCELVNNSDNMTNTTSEYIGGIAGEIENCRIENCVNTGDIYGKSSIGGIVGADFRYSTIYNCSNSGKIKSYGISFMSWETGSGEISILGGICGIGKEANTVIEKCSNTGEIEVDAPSVSPYAVCVGGVVGFLNNSEVRTSKNNGNVHYDSLSYVQSSSVSGIVGGSIRSTIEQCFNTGEVIARQCPGVGGIVGGMQSSTMRNSYNIGGIYGRYGVGGILGGIEAGNNYILNCYNQNATIEGNEHVGNLIGYNFATITATNVSWITGTSKIGYGNNCTFVNDKNYTANEMKTLNSGLLTLLSNGEGRGIWAQEENKNDGLPYLINNKP